MTVFDRIKNLCELKGISISQLEERIEISSGAAYKWKTSSPSQKMFQKLSTFFAYSVGISILASTILQNSRTISFGFLQTFPNPSFSYEKYPSW